MSSYLYPSLGALFGSLSAFVVLAKASDDPIDRRFPLPFPATIAVLIGGGFVGFIAGLIATLLT